MVRWYKTRNILLPVCSSQDLSRDQVTHGVFMMYISQLDHNDWTKKGGNGMELAKVKLITINAAVGIPSGGTRECAVAGGGGWKSS